MLVDGSGGAESVASVLDRAMAAEVGTERVGVGEGDVDGMIVFTICCCCDDATRHGLGEPQSRTWVAVLKPKLG
jgi:hypothetical protein